MNNCCLCNTPLYHPDDQTEQAQMQHTVLLYHTRPMSEAHYGCAADYHHDLELDREPGQRVDY